MAKELPYFKFEPAEYIAKDIQECSLEAQGAFINICSLYWIKLGSLSYASALRRVCGGNAELIRELQDSGVIKVEDDEIEITFLDKQLEEFDELSRKNSENARKRWNKATAKRPQSDRNAIREEKRREEESKEENSGAFASSKKIDERKRKIHIASLAPKYQLSEEAEPSTEKEEKEQPHLHPYLDEFCKLFNLPMGIPSFHTPVRRVNGYLKKIEEAGEIEYFKKQVEYYFKAKSLNPGEKIAGWMGWLGVNDNSPIWQAADYESLYLRESQNREFDKKNGATVSRANPSIRNR